MKKSSIFAVLVIMAIASVSALAVDFYWNVASGDWSVGANWDPAGPPDGTGKAFIDNGGTLNIDVDLATLSDAQQIRLDNGIINQSANSVTTGYLMIADGGDATYNFSGDSINATSGMRVGNGDLSNGYFNMTGGTLDVGTSADLVVGYAGYGEFNLTGGTINVADDFFMGDQAGSHGVVNQTGGVVNVAGKLFIGQYDSNPFGPKSGTGAYNMEGGTLNVAEEIRVGAENGAIQGQLNLKGGEITTTDFYVHSGGYVDDQEATICSGTKLNVWGDFLNESTNALNFSMARTTLAMMGGGVGWDPNAGDWGEWDYVTIDMGDVVDYGDDYQNGLTNNYAVGNLVFHGTDTGSIWYMVESDIYCYGLVIEEGAVVVLNGGSIYYMPENAVSYNGSKPCTHLIEGVAFEIGGSLVELTAPIEEIPEPGTIVLLGSGILGLAAVLRKKYC